MKYAWLFLIAGAAAAQDQPYKAGLTYQSGNPNYPVRNPFYFEGRIDWDLLQIHQPSNAWEFAQRGIHRQDDLEDFQGAIDDYRKAISMNSLVDGSCQLITAAPVGFGQAVDPPPCMFTARLRLGNLLLRTSPTEALALFQEVLTIDPLRLAVNAMIAETYAVMADGAGDPNEKRQFVQNALSVYQAELALSPVTPLSIKLTGDEANNAHVHWQLAALYEKAGQSGDAASELDLYLKATKWHSDTYPWRIDLARKKIARLREASKAPLSQQ
jgi:tetratricopeptide (TPR) repeat protein